MDNSVLEKMVTSDGESVMELSKKKPLLVVFLRHFGCIFCREALQDLSKLQDEIQEKGGDLVFIHMANKETAEQYFKKYKLVNPKWVQDSECKYYQEFGLVKGTFNQLFGFKNWVRGVDAAIIKGNGVSWKQLGDGFQMPGVFLIDNGDIKYSFVHNSAADRPNYLDILSKVEQFKN
ncbi:peroxiredoxin-like family protein [Portibacter lacus]|uniref:Peroxiredoxin n=1 Tax=Portibacter lacus TaxID=1099794 RepID=A0AA37SLL2_9BACT|nr:peroxiredoxin-like family protein [Portibacter lacus]GLR16367.1 peroxiredoxin [Portibacter lacus]